ncbi:MAG: HIT family protein [Burkholderiaceae bacterium]|nr:HIT family protein [Burkholderiaceae bacterium]
MAQGDQLQGCELCESPGGFVVVQTPLLRVLRIEDVSFPAFYRVVWTAHRAEFTDLSPSERSLCLEAVARVETVLREHLRPTKINLASLGNMVAHLHWHVIARFDWDSHFPQPIWGQAQREVEPPAVSRLPLPLFELDRHVANAFG